MNVEVKGSSIQFTEYFSKGSRGDSVYETIESIVPVFNRGAALSAQLQRIDRSIHEAFD